MKRISLVWVAVVVTACSLGVGVAAAQAITIEPLNKSFEGETSVSLSFLHGGKLTCHLKVSGTTNATKTNYVNITPALTECTSGIGGWKYTNTTTCEKEQTVPWTLTLTEGTNPFTGSMAVNCVGKITQTLCEIEILRQTAAKSVRWETTGENSWLTLNASLFKYKANNGCSGLLGISPGEGTLTLSAAPSWEIKGIKAV